MQIELGALCKPLSEQLKGYIPDDKLKVMDADADAITRLLLRGFIPESIAKKARQKLVRAVQVQMGEG